MKMPRRLTREKEDQSDEDVMEETHKFAAEIANSTGARGSWSSRERQARLLMTGVAGRVGLGLCGEERPPRL